MNRFVITIWPIIFSLMISTSETTCNPPHDDPALAFHNADLVFDGLVLSNEIDFPFYLKLYSSILRYFPGDHSFPFYSEYSYVNIQVYRSWKTISSENIQLKVPSGSCSVHLQKGERYLIYAYQNISDGELITGILFQTKPINLASGDLSFLQPFTEIPLERSHNNEMVFVLGALVITMFVIVFLWKRNRSFYLISGS